MVRLLALLMTAAALLVAPTAAVTPVMPVDEVRPGMVGIGRTVFSGDTIEEFRAHILGTLQNVVGPRRTLILARLEGGPLAKTGVIAGMSGSPVYIDGRLIGAVSYQLGQFPTEAIAGITPIEEMTEATALESRPRQSRPVALAWPPTPQALFEVWREGLGLSRPFAEQAGDLTVLASGGDVTSGLGTLLRPITVPLVTSGFTAGVLDPLIPALSAQGFVPVSGAGVPGQAPAAAPTAAALAPGDAVGVALLSGDFALGATGTVTHVDGDRVYAFGHPLYNLGPTEFPMTRADVLTLLPSLFTSSKLASLGAVIGTVQQDRATAIAGRLGPGPQLIPLTVTLNSEHTPSRTFTFGMVKDQTFTPLLTYLAVANVLTSYERQVGAATFTVRGTATIRKHGDIAFEDIFAGDQPASVAAAYVAAPLTLLLRNTTDPIEVERFDLTIDATEEPRTARIERVWIDTPRPRAGRAVDVSVQLRNWRGEESTHRVSVQLPANATGTLQLLVADGPRMAQQEAREMRLGGDLQDVSQMIRTFNRARRSNRLYVRLTSPDAGAVVGGEAMPSLPPSVLAVLEGDRHSGNFAALRTAVRGEWEIPVDVAVTGSRTLTLTLNQP
ncbi:MAG: SpoIVB peptidase S55 domain-containing protein [Vicinamibacterales bacterium]|nr:SpoIVB peptidase S55 domain-containing protein [Vicinamibacterales bacterium]